MEEVQSFEKLCLACNRWHPHHIMSCQCGHVLKDSITRNKTGIDCFYHMRNSSSIRNGSLSSESTLSSSSSSPSPQGYRQFTFHDKLNIPSPGSTRQKSPKRHHSPVPARQKSPKNNAYKENRKKEKQPKFPRVIYRCKSYKKAKPSEMNFQFDFTMFDSNDPNYPSALSDINDRINRQNALSRILNKYS